MTGGKQAAAVAGLTDGETALMRTVTNGRDVFDESTAAALRALQERFADFVTLGGAHALYAPDQARPILGAILTPRGRAAIATERRCSRCKDSFPATPEFFRLRTGSTCRFFSWCRACLLEHRLERYAVYSEWRAANPEAARAPRGNPQPTTEVPQCL